MTNSSFFHSIVLVLLSFPSSIFSTKSSTCHPNDYTLLLAFKSSITDGSIYHRLKIWNTTDCCEWDGIVCDPLSGHVVTLSRPAHYGDRDGIYEAPMTGTIPSAISGLAHLHILDLSNLKHLSGTIPVSLGSLTSLTQISLEGNSLTGTIPPSLGNLIHLEMLHLGQLKLLEYLDLHLNNLSGSLPMDIGMLSELICLDISNNQISGSLPASIGNLSKLDVLDLSRNQLTGTIPSSMFSGMLSLRILCLFNNQLTGTLPDLFDGHGNIEIFLFSDNKLTGEIPATIANLSNVWEFDLRNNQLTGNIPSSIGNMKKLDCLRLSNNNLSGLLPDELSKLRLGEVLLSYNQFNLSSFPIWLANTSLSGLEMAGLGISGPLPEWLSSQTHMAKLDLSSNKPFGEILAWFGNMPLYDLT